MKRTVLVVTIVAVAIATISANLAFGQAPTQPQIPMGPGQGMGGGPMGPGMMGQGMGPGQPMCGGAMGPGMMGRGPMGPGGRRADPEDRPLISIVLQLRQQLGLSAEQVSKLTAMRSEFEKEAIRVGAEIRVIEVDLDDLLEQEKVDLGKVEAAIRKGETLRGNLRISRIKTIESGKALLTVEQRDKLKKALEAGPGMGMMGQGMMGPGQPMGGGPMGMMGSGGQGQGMMMGPQMMQQMMGGGMGQQAAAAPSASPTGQVGGKRTDATGPVTVEATLLDPGKASDRIRIEFVLDTHSVELDGYKLESLMTLRTDTGKSVQPIAIESPSGSGHHRKGILVFPGTDASGSLLAGAKTVELIVRDVGGVKERALSWTLP